MRRLSRLLVAPATALALVFSIVVATPAHAATFVDVPEGAPFYEDIEWTAEQGISLGWTTSEGRMFGPTQNVERGQMGAFMYRLATSPSFNPHSTSCRFPDVSSSHLFYREICWMSTRGITKGYADGRFRPKSAVERGSMAAFMYRLAGSPAYTPPTTSPFTDLGTGSPFYKEISWMASTGVSTGYTDGSYRPLAPVQRGAMAAFLRRLHDAGLIAHSYSFMMTQDDGVSPVTWPCQGPIPVRVNAQGAPAGYSTLINTSLTRLNAVSGLKFAVTGQTTDRNFFERRDGTVLLGFADETEFRQLGGGVVGIGGFTASWRSDRPRWMANGGLLLLDKADLPTLTTAEQEAVVLHELMHVLGLGHVASEDELMFFMVNETDFGRSDKQGLKHLHEFACSPITSTATPTQSSAEDPEDRHVWLP